jgi:hypothetical protein
MQAPTGSQLLVCFRHGNIVLCLLRVPTGSLSLSLFLSFSHPRTLFLRFHVLSLCSLSISHSLGVSLSYSARLLQSGEFGFASCSRCVFALLVETCIVRSSFCSDPAPAHGRNMQQQRQTLTLAALEATHGPSVRDARQPAKIFALRLHRICGLFGCPSPWACLSGYARCMHRLTHPHREEEGAASARPPVSTKCVVQRRMGLNKKRHKNIHIHEHAHKHRYKHTHTHTHTLTQTSTHRYRHRHKHTHTHTHTHTLAYTCTHRVTRTQSRTHTHTHFHRLAYTPLHTHAERHTHTRTHRLCSKIKVFPSITF